MSEAEENVGGYDHTQTPGHFEWTGDDEHQQLDPETTVMPHWMLDYGQEETSEEFGEQVNRSKDHATEKGASNKSSGVTIGTTVGEVRASPQVITRSGSASVRASLKRGSGAQVPSHAAIEEEDSRPPRARRQNFNAVEERDDACCFDGRSEGRERELTNERVFFKENEQQLSDPNVGHHTSHSTPTTDNGDILLEVPGIVGPGKRKSRKANTDDRLANPEKSLEATSNKNKVMQDHFEISREITDDSPRLSGHQGGKIGLLHKTLPPSGREAGKWRNSDKTQECAEMENPVYSEEQGLTDLGDALEVKENESAALQIGVVERSLVPQKLKETDRQKSKAGQVKAEKPEGRREHASAEVRSSREPAGKVNPTGRVAQLPAETARLESRVKKSQQAQETAKKAGQELERPKQDAGAKGSVYPNLKEQATGSGTYQKRASKPEDESKGATRRMPQYEGQEQNLKAEPDKVSNYEQQVFKLREQPGNSGLKADQQDQLFPKMIKEPRLKIEEGEHHQNEAAKLQPRVQSPEQEVLERRERTSELEKQVRDSKAVAGRYRQRVSDLESQLKAKSGDADDLASQLNVRKRGIDDYRKMETQSRSEMGRRLKASEPKQEIQGLKEETADADKQRSLAARLTEAKKYLNGGIDNLKRAVDDGRRREAQLRSRLSQGEANTTAADERHVQKVAALEAKVRELSPKAEQAHHQQRLATSLDQEVRKLRDEVDFYQQKDKQELHKQQHDMGQYRHRNSRLSADLEKLKRELETSREKQRQDAAASLTKVNALDLEIARHLQRQERDATIIKELKEEVARIHAVGYQEQIRELRRDVKRREDKEATYRKELSAVREPLNKKEREAEKREAENVDLKNDVAGPRTEPASLQARCSLSSQGKKTHALLEQELKHNQEEIVELKKKIEKQEAYVTSAQETAMQMLEMKAAEETQTVEDEELEGIFQIEFETRPKKWAYKYAIPKSDESSIVLNPALEVEIRKIAGREKDVKQLFRRYDPDIIVNALVVQFITENVINKPFFPFELEGGKDFAAKMTKWYETRLAEDKTAANRWRQQEIQWLHATMPRHSSEKSTTEGDPIKVDDTKCTELAKGFLNGPAKTLLRENVDEGLQDLAIIIKQAVRIGFVMWRQPLDIQFRGYEDLKGRRFSIEQKEVKTHPSQLDPTRLPSEDAVVDMVVQPSCVVRQDEHAEKVWCQAIVLWH